VVVQSEKHFPLILNHPPVRSIKGRFAISLDIAATPPAAQEGSIAYDTLACRCSGISELCAPNDVWCHPGFEFLDFDEVFDNVYVFSFIRH